MNLTSTSQPVPSWSCLPNPGTPVHRYMALPFNYLRNAISDPDHRLLQLNNPRASNGPWELLRPKKALAIILSPSPTPGLFPKGVQKKMKPFSLSLIPQQLPPQPPPNPARNLWTSLLLEPPLPRTSQPVTALSFKSLKGVQPELLLPGSSEAVKNAHCL